MSTSDSSASRVRASRASGSAGAHTKLPPRRPRFVVTRPSSRSVCSDSRAVTGATPNDPASSISLGSCSPSRSTPSTIASRSRRVTASARPGWVSGANTARRAGGTAGTGIIAPVLKDFRRRAPGAAEPIRGGPCALNYEAIGFRRSKPFALGLPPTAGSSDGAENPEQTRSEARVEPTPAIRLSGLRKQFGDTTAVDGIDLEIADGEFFAMLGPSGSGKTTVLRMIAGFELPTAGTIALGGVDVTRAAPFQREVTTVFQDYALFPHLSVRENVEYGLAVRRVGRAQRRTRADEALARVQMAGYGDRKPGHL